MALRRIVHASGGNRRKAGKEESRHAIERIVCGNILELRCRRVRTAIDFIAEAVSLVRKPEAELIEQVRRNGVGHGAGEDAEVIKVRNRGKEKVLRRQARNILEGIARKRLEFLVELVVEPGVELVRV